MEKGDAKQLNVSCVERMAPPPFVTEVASPKTN
jgi:hypothetical protein